MVSSRSDRGSWGIVLSFSSLSCGIASAASHMSEGGTGGLWDNGIRLCLGSWLRGGIYQGHLARWGR